MKHLKRFWNWLLGKTTIDEKIEAKVDEVVEEVKERVGRIKEEFSDVKEAISEVADQPDRDWETRRPTTPQTPSSPSPRMLISHPAPSLDLQQILTYMGFCFHRHR